MKREVVKAKREDNNKEEGNLLKEERRGQRMGMNGKLGKGRGKTGKRMGMKRKIRKGRK